MKTVVAACAVLTLTACATPTPTPPPDGAGDDCAVIAAVAREHYGFGPDSTPPPLWLVDSDGWAPRRDWGRVGLRFPTIYDPDRSGDGTTGVDPWVSFERPTYDGQGATIESSTVRGPRVGGGVRCRVRPGFAGWTVDRCEPTWAS